VPDNRRVQDLAIGLACHLHGMQSAINTLLVAFVSALAICQGFALQGSSELYGVVLDAGVSGAIVANNHFLQQKRALSRPADAKGLFSYVTYFGNVARSVEQEIDVIMGPDVVLQTLGDAFRAAFNASAG
jgi:hypothetical protein